MSPDEESCVDTVVYGKKSLVLDCSTLAYRKGIDNQKT